MSEVDSKRRVRPNLFLWVAVLLKGSSIPPLWTSLRTLSNSNAARATLLLPLVGYMIVFNESLVKYLGLVQEIDGHQQAVIPTRLLLLYFGLCFVALGTLIYSVFCPTEAKRFDGPSSFVGHAEHNVPMTVRESYESELKFTPYELRVDSLHREDYEDVHFWKAFLYIYFQYLDDKHPAARAATMYAYIIGFVLLLIPSVGVFMKVVRYAVLG